MNIKEKLYRIVQEKLQEMTPVVEKSPLAEEARVKIIKARIRNGKIQRRKKVSNVPGFTMRGGKLTKMSAKERMDRKRGAKRGKVKRKAKMARALMKRKRSMQKRASLGLSESKSSTLIENPLLALAGRSLATRVAARLGARKIEQKVAGSVAKKLMSKSPSIESDTNSQLPPSNRRI